MIYSRYPIKPEGLSEWSGFQDGHPADGIECKVDAAGRVRINAIHEAAGGLEKDLPKRWLDTKSAQELRARIEAGKSNGGIPPLPMKTATFTIKGQRSDGSQGTYVHPDMLCAYAQWTSADFGLQVAVPSPPRRRAGALADIPAFALSVDRVRSLASAEVAIQRRLDTEVQAWHSTS